MALSGIRRVTGNAASILASDMVNRATTFILYILIGRYLGPYEFGQMSLALTLFYLFQVLAAAGLKTFITREVARDRVKTGEYIVHGTAAVLITSSLALAALWLFVRVMNYSPDTAAVVLLIGLALLPYSLSSVSEGVFQAWEKMRYIAYANGVGHVGKIALAFLLLSLGYGIYHVVIVMFVAHTAVAVVEWWLMLRQVERPRVRVERAALLATIRSTSTFLGIDGTIAIMTSTNVLLLSAFAGESQVGFYSAAAQLLIPVSIVFRAIGLAVFPMMVRRFQSSTMDLKRMSGPLIQLMLAVALPAVVGLHFLAGSVLLLIYGDQRFLAAAVALQIMAWGLVSTALTKVLGHALLAGMKERVTLQIVLVDAVAGLLLGFVLIPTYGIMGAAVTGLVVRILDLALHYLFASRLLGGMAIAKWVWKPVVASGLMAAYLSVVDGYGLFLAGVSSVLLYLAVLGVLFVWSMGGVAQLRSSWNSLRSD